MSRRCHSLSLARAAREEFSTQHKATTPSMTPVLSSFDIKSQNPKNSLNFHSLLFSTTTSSSYNYLISHQSSRNSIKRVVRRPNIKQPYGNIIKKKIWSWFDELLIISWAAYACCQRVITFISGSLPPLPCRGNLLLLPMLCLLLLHLQFFMQQDAAMHAFTRVARLASCMEHHVHLIFGVCLL
jgi:hypothetical protein